MRTWYLWTHATHANARTYKETLIKKSLRPKWRQSADGKKRLLLVFRTKLVFFVFSPRTGRNFFHLSQVSNSLPDTFEVATACNALRCCSCNQSSSTSSTSLVLELSVSFFFVCYTSFSLTTIISDTAPDSLRSFAKTMHNCANYGHAYE